MMRGETNPAGQHSRETWAKAVVNDLLQSNPRSYVRRGYLATTMRVMTSLVPTWLFDWMFTKSGHLDKLKVTLNEQENKKDQ